MPTTLEHPDLAVMLARLRADADAIPWPERRELAHLLANAIQTTPRPAAALPLICILAEDAKPEVRHAIALLLPFLDEADLARIAGTLANDSNAFVQKAVERGLDRRRRGREDADRRRHCAERVHGAYAAIERLHGQPAAERARQMCERFAEVLVGTAVHNMRGVLTPMKLNAAALLRQLDSGQPNARVVRDAAVKITERVAFLERLLDDMRAFSQTVATTRRQERLADVVAEARATVAEYFRASGRDPSNVTVTAAVAPNITAEIARHQIVAALANILKNAHEALAEGDAFRPGQIVVSAVVAGDEVRVVVQDNGPGLAAEDLCELREFVPGRTSKKNQGTGYGLPIARRYVIAHGGTLAIDSQVGQGTTVMITLPLEAEVTEEA